MRFSLFCTLLAGALLTGFMAPSPQKAVSLFDGKTFRGWEGDTLKTWRIEDGALVGGSLTETVPKNDFLCTTREYANFILRVKFKLLGTDGFVNTGVQFRSKRLTNPAHEMTGYQADLGDGYWASLYDESRRNKTLVKPDSVLIAKILKRNDWNDYEIRAENRRIRLYLNGKQTIDYTEPDQTIPQTGLIGLQIHGGGKALVYYKDLMLEELR
ncbi:3-keto-disaccharide hydrolase [Larkinella arboricola]|uniref:Uncharacterized protein DUF1080 n=1 Tax=Larkinella arboricola TaxID=643671 RepID=A0A327WTZ2_LARAB|nr:DUF1080 domain-containing protein [Larkinella arboricola]RAJ94501.1 uncharacterized protein DUF1080 [Larkinella arboricola]